MKEFPRLSGRLYFFPAFLPLVELVPWLLGLIGAVAGIAGFSAPQFFRKHKTKIIIFFMICFMVISGFYISRIPPRDIKEVGSKLVAIEDLPTPYVFNSAHSSPKNIFYTDFSEIWSKEIPISLLSSPVLSEGKLIYGSYGKTVEAISAENGEQLWTLHQKAPVLTISEGKNGIVYAGEGFHDTIVSGLSAIDTSNGKIIWRRDFLGHLEETMIYDEKKDRLFLGSGPGGIWSLDASNGGVLWSKKIGHMDSTPLLYKDHIYAAIQVDEAVKESTLFSLNADNGKTAWSLTLPGQPWGSPILENKNKTILTTSGVGQIGITRGSDRGWAQSVSMQGKLLWQQELPSMAIQPSHYIENADMVIHTSKNGGISALNIATGSPIWRTKIGEDIQSPATLIKIGDKYMLAVNSYDGKFAILNALTGEIIFKLGIKTGSTSSPIVKDDVIYITTPSEIRAFGGLHILAERI